ncbi:Bug family tripartite tricarboxylate transporter substrate binding protein [Rhodovarius lipocyclicus]|uniref:Bug family tripartite tricarboxylate transporter substrate binding protein n=1 Tax=Rhodovarius lipocyclicus TaxID=268410 RepID=UPI00135CAD95|nr:tripartite tricarboxylate transporter substrate binding protein [Rhodovarius lipocyclicus]
MSAPASRPKAGLPRHVARRALLPLLAAPVLACARGVARAQGVWAPSRQLRLIVPFPPGGSTDMLARLTAERMGAALGQPMVVDNRGGAAGSLAADMAAKAEPDGHTVFFCSVGTAATNQFVYRHIPHPGEALTEVAAMFALPNVATVPPGAPWTNLGEFISAAREAPGRLTYGSSGAGSSLHLTGAMLAHRAGIDILHVPYRGGGQMLNELVAGRISIAFGNLPTAIGLLQAGTLRPIAVSGAARSPILPDVPSMAETLPGFATTVWYGLQVPRGTPPAAIARLNAEANAALAAPEARARFEPQGVSAMGGSPQDFTRFVRAETAQWREIITAAQITAD